VTAAREKGNPAHFIQ